MSLRAVNPRRLWPRCLDRSLGRVVFGLVVVLLSLPAKAQTSTSPDEGIQSRPSNVVLFQGGHVVVSPEKEIEQADILIRDGRIVEVGTRITPPVDALVIKCEGKYLYPAFIDPLVEISVAASPKPDDHWNVNVQPQRTAASSLPADDKTAAQYRKAGFGVVLVAPSDGIFKGSSAVVTTAKMSATQTVLRPNAFQHVALVQGRGERSSGYPTSPMGVVALVRQTLSDANWYLQAQQAFRADPSLPAPDKNGALESLSALVRGEQSAIFDSGNELYALRADRMAREFSLRAVIRGSGREYRRLDSIVETGRTYIIPVDFPKPPDVNTLDAASTVPLQSLMHWHLAPENPGKLEAANVSFVLTASGLTSPTELLEQVRKAIARGLSESAALAALTSRTARLLEIDQLAGTLERGKLANVLITSGPIWDKKTTIEETWVQGQRYRYQERSKIDASGTWKSTAGFNDKIRSQVELLLENMADKPKGQIGLPGEIDKLKAASTSRSGPRAPRSNSDAADAKSESPSDKPEKPLELKKPESDNPPNDDSRQDLNKPVVPPPPSEKPSDKDEDKDKTRTVRKTRTTKTKRAMRARPRMHPLTSLIRTARPTRRKSLHRKPPS